MAAFARNLGLVLVAVAVCLPLVSSAGWLPPDRVDPWILPGLQAGGALVLLGVTAGLLGSLARMLGRGRCVRCGRGIERGQSYCIDHLRETVAEYREHQRDARGTRI